MPKVFNHVLTKGNQGLIHPTQCRFEEVLKKSWYLRILHYISTFQITVQILASSRMPLFNYISKRPSPQQEDTQNSKTECKTDTVKTGMKAYMKNYCSHRKENGQNVYRTILTETFHDEENGIRKVEVGEKSSKSVEETVVLLIGATGSGKSTLVDAVFNHILGVTWENDFRFKLTEEDSISGQSASQTQRITAYTIHHQDWFQIPSTLTIVDTPGLGSTEGMKRDQEIMKQIKTLLQGNKSC